MSEYPRSQEEIYDATLRGFLMFAERRKKIINFHEDGKDSLEEYRAAKDRLNQLYDFVARIQMDGLFNENRKDMCLKIIKLLTDITKIEGDKFLKGFILN